MAKKTKTEPAASKWPKFSDDAAVQKHYEECRDNGCSESMAEMLAGKKAIPFHNHFSPMHPRHNRGRGY